MMKIKILEHNCIKITFETFAIQLYALSNDCFIDFDKEKTGARLQGVESNNNIHIFAKGDGR